MLNIQVRSRIVKYVSKITNISLSQTSTAFDVYLKSVRIEIDTSTNDALDLELYQNLFYSRESAPIYEIVCNGHLIMSNYSVYSEEMLAMLAVMKMNNKPDVKMLMAGLGMGCTLRKALSYDTVAHIDVVEKIPAIVKWNKKYFCSINNYSLYDKRVRIILCDFIKYVKNLYLDRTYDSIIIDIDNGSKGAVLSENLEIYTVAFLKLVRNMLKANGSVFFWSLYKDRNFMDRLEKIFLNVKENEVVENYLKLKSKSYIYSAKINEANKS